MRTNIITEAQSTAGWLHPISEKKKTRLPSLIPIPDGVIGSNDMAKYAASNAINPWIFRTFILYPVRASINAKAASRLAASDIERSEINCLIDLLPN